jgi:hypothetical protein
MANEMQPPIDPEKLGLRRIGSIVNLDKRGRVVLGKALREALHGTRRFAVFVNRAGQLILDPIKRQPSAEEPNPVD